MTSDAELIARSLAGDEDAFVQMISRHEAGISRYLVRQVGRDAAEDLLGEVWIAAFTSRAGYDQAYPDARPWMYAVALNQVRRRWRSRKPEFLVADVNDLRLEWDPWPTVEMRVDAQEALRGALAALRPDELDVLTLVAGEDLAVADAARALDLPAAKARRLLYQARQKMRENPLLAALLTDINSAKRSE